MAGPDTFVVKEDQRLQQSFIDQPRSVRLRNAFLSITAAPNSVGIQTFYDYPYPDVFKALLAATQRTVYYYASMVDNLGNRTSVIYTFTSTYIFT